MKKPSFLLVCHSYPPVLGGSEMEAQRVCVEMLRRGYRVEVLCAGGDPMPNLKRWRDPLGVPVRMFGAKWKGRTLRAWVYALGVGWTMLTAHRRYDFVYFLMQGLQLLTGLPLARILGKPVIMKISGSSVIPFIASSRAGRVELAMLRRWAYRILILNPGMVEEALRYGFDRRQLLWMPNPVDMKRFAPCASPERAAVRASLGVSAEAKVVVYTGRLSSEKGVDVLIESFSRIARDVPDAMLALVGDGVERAALEAQAERSGIAARVRFTGRLTSEQLLLWLQAADIFALVSPDEGLSVSLLEALSVGLPAVVTAIPANTQVVDDGVEGLTAPAGDREAVAQALLRLLTDDELRHRMGVAARARVGEFSTENVGDRYEELFQELLGRQF